VRYTDSKTTTKGTAVLKKFIVTRTIKGEVVRLTIMARNAAEAGRAADAAAARRREAVGA
jgi:hypothetical protein